MKSLALLLCLLAYCRANAAEPMQYLSWGEAKTLCRADGKPIVMLMGADWCGPCRQMRDVVLPSLHRRGVLQTVHVAYLNTDRNRELFESLREQAGIPQLLITDLKNRRIQVGLMDEERTLRWLRGQK